MATINTNPIYSGIGAIGGVTITAANTESTGSGTIGTNIFLAFIADVNFGSYVSKVRLIPTAATAATNTTATTIRIFASSVFNGTTSGGVNTFLIAEYAASAQSADNSTNAVYYADIMLNFALPPQWTILVTSHIAPATNTAWQAVVIAGNYTAQP